MEALNYHLLVVQGIAMQPENVFINNDYRSLLLLKLQITVCNNSNMNGVVVLIEAFF